MIQDFEDLLVWQKAVDLAANVYDLTARFPASERFGLTSQLRRAAVSVSSNIAEGNGRATTNDYLNFLSHSRGSTFETRSLLRVSTRVDLVRRAEVEPFYELTNEIGRMLSGLRTSLKRRASRR